MPYFAANGISVGQAWSDRSQFPAQGFMPWPITKVDVFANGTDAVLQGLEAEEGAFQDDVSREILCPMGFHSIEPKTPFVAVRFKVWGSTLLATTGTVHVRLFG